MSDAQRLSIGGRVQGVGYRPYIFRLAHTFQLTGWVRNNAGTVEVHAEGPTDRLEAFALAIFSQPPPTSRAHLLSRTPVSAEWRNGFSIFPSAIDGERHVSVPQDLACCAECASEMRDPLARRYRYPFINCTQCGPRYTIIRDLPYDRSNTTLQDFALCAACAAEYLDPLDRRFHAQPLACPACGPRLSWCASGVESSHGAEALAAAVAALHSESILAVCGVGGYHLICDAGSESAVARLRHLKGRPAKPFAIMVPWAGDDGLAAVRRIANLGTLESESLLEASRPIVVLTRHPQSAPAICAAVSPNSDSLGVMLPYSPLHLLLLEDFGAPLVATSGNVRNEPVMTEPHEVQARLGFIAEGFLHHNRPIARPAEDPVVRRIGGAIRPLRLGRGTAPTELSLAVRMDVPTLAVGAFDKSTIALAYEYRAIVSPHLGDQTTPRGRANFQRSIEELQQLYGRRAERVMHDVHPRFPATRWALGCGLPATAIWHHHAHASAVAGEYRRHEPLLCFTWDGLGLGSDETLWGGEALLGSPGQWRRVASFRPFKLPGGERAAREPWRTALSLCWQTGVAWSAGAAWDDGLLHRAFDQGMNSPVTSSVGRLFDAGAALIDLCQESSFDGEAPSLLETSCDSVGKSAPLVLPLRRDENALWRSDWAPLLPMMLDTSLTLGERASRFHSSLAHALLAQALVVREETRVATVGLAGGVFQNRVLTEHVVNLLEVAGFDVLIPSVLPLNDAGISFGQIIEGNMRLATSA